MHRRKQHSAAFILGFADGLVLPIALITALVLLMENNTSLLQTGSMFILFFAVVMGLSHYYTQRHHTDTSIKTETFQNIGLSAELELQLLHDHEQEKQEWEDVLKENEFVQSKGFTASWITGVAYLLSGMALLLPFLFVPMRQAYWLACIACGLLMVFFGFLKAKITGNHPARVILRNLFNAVVLSALVYGVMELLEASGH